MAINALEIVAFMSLLTHRLARDNAKHLQGMRVKLVMMAVRALVGFSGIVVAASNSYTQSGRSANVSDVQRKLKVRVGQVEAAPTF